MKNLKAAVLFLGLICLSFLLSQKPANAAATTDNVNGVYIDNFSDNTGLVTRDKTGVSQGKLQLLNASNGTTTPLVSTGYAITNSIWPQLLAKWGTLTFDAVTSATTSIKIQITDNESNLFPDSIIPGNSTGFTSSPVDLSFLSTMVTATTSYSDYPPKNNAIGFKITLSTANGKYTPTIDNLRFTWTKTQGDLSSSTLAVSAWPTTEANNQGTAYTPYYPDSIYPAIKWIKPLGNQGKSRTLVGKNSIIYNSTQGVNFIWGNSTAGNSTLQAIDSLTGNTIWQKKMMWSADLITLAENGTIYRSDAVNDNICAFDGADGSVKWCYMFYGGHSNDRVALGNDGTVYTYRVNDGLYAFRPDGSVKWIRSFSLSPGSSGMDAEFQNVSFNSDGDLYIGTIEYDADGNYDNNGHLYIINHRDGSILHSVNTGDVGCANIAIDKNDVAYVANGCSNLNEEGKILAVNKDGTIKWTYRTYVNLTWGKLSLRSDGVLLAERAGFFSGGKIYAVNVSDGSEVWQSSDLSTNITWPADVITNGLNGFYHSTQTFDGSNSVLAANLFYFDASFNNKWKMSAPVSNPNSWYTEYFFEDPVMDERGNIFVSYNEMITSESTYSITADHNTLLSLVPWHLSLSSNLAASYYRGNTINITAKSSMPAINPFNNEANKVQAVVDGNTKIPLTYGATDSNGNTLWTGSYTIPQSSNIGNHNIVLEAAQSMITTDASTTFATYPSGTNNTGIRSTSTFALILPNSSSLPSGYNAQPGSTPAKPANAVFSIQINNGETTTDNRNITLSLTASPDTKNIAISENPNFQFASLEPFTPTKQYQLSSGNGLKTIYVKFYTKYGYSSSPYSASIVLNEKANTIPVIGQNNPVNSVPGSTVSQPVSVPTVISDLPFGFTFHRILQSGQSNPDVRKLQEFLKSLGKEIYPDARITGYFGPLTRQAVIRFQEKYAKEILAPQGLKHGNGRVGPATLKKINAILNSWAKK
jgi:hypothetical protein